MGTPPRYGPRDFAAWLEVYLGGRWSGALVTPTTAAQHHIPTKCPEGLQGLDRRGAVVTSLEGRSSA